MADSFIDDYEVDELINSVLEKGSLDDCFYIKELQRRILYLRADQIDSFSITDAIRNIMMYNLDDVELSEDKRKPILLYISTYGGDVIAGYELIDVITTSKTPVYTISTGRSYSMGFLIALAGKKRFCMPHTSFLLHDGSMFIADSSLKVKDRMVFEEKLEEKSMSFILEHSTLTREEYEEHQRAEWYMFPEEAKAKGFVDYIIGKDCDFNLKT